MSERASIADEVGSQLVWTAVLAVGAAALAGGRELLGDGGALALYLALALALLLLAAAPAIDREPFCTLVRHVPRYILLFGGIALATQTLSGERFVLPMVFTVPVVHAALHYRPRRAALVGLLMCGLLTLGLWLAGQRDPAALLSSTAAYGALMAVIATFTYQSVQQAEARRGANALAAELAAERDRLAALVAENAALAEAAAGAATLAERNRLARELHDTIAQGLTAVTLQIAAAERAFGRDPERAQQRLTRAHELAQLTLDDVRRSVWTLAEPPVDAAGLPAALDALAAQVAQRSGLALRAEHRGALSISDAAATQALRIAQEALHNVEKHAGARSVTIATDGGEHFVMRIADDGVGFDPALPRAGFGLRSLAERARLAGGALDVQSAPDGGTVVQLTIP